MRYSPGLHRVIALFGARFTGFVSIMVSDSLGLTRYKINHSPGSVHLPMRISSGFYHYIYEIHWVYANIYFVFHWVSSLGFVTISSGLVISVLRYSPGSYQKNKPNESENTFQIHWVCVHKIWCRFWHKMKPVIDETINKNSNA